MRRLIAPALTAALLCGGLGACASLPWMHKDAVPVAANAPVAMAAPQPAKPVDAGLLYNGAWYEVARTRQVLTHDCVAARTIFTRDAKGVLTDHDSCRAENADFGDKAVFRGTVTLDDPASGAKFTTSRRVFWLFDAKRSWWVLDHDAAYTWFIVASPDFMSLSIYDRDPRISPAERATLAGYAKALGYDTAHLEYPPQPLA